MIDAALAHLLITHSRHLHDARNAVRAGWRRLALPAGVTGSAQSRLLIAGIPGTGKTTAAAYIALTCGWTHSDIGAAPAYPRRHAFRATPPVVTSWNGGSLAGHMAAGYRVVWLDGDHVAAFGHYMRREHASAEAEAAFHAAMISILASGNPAALGLPVICPFRPDGSFRPVADIAADILAAAYP